MASNSSPLLINESPLQVLPSLAKALGNVNEAIILQQIQYWLKNPKSGRVGEDGRKYIRDTYDEWQQQLTWLSTRTIKSRIKSLQNKGLLLTANLNKSKYDRTNWYSIDYDKLNELMQSEETSLSKVKKVTNLYLRLHLRVQLKLLLRNIVHLQSRVNHLFLTKTLSIILTKRLVLTINNPVKLTES